MLKHGKLIPLVCVIPIALLVACAQVQPQPQAEEETTTVEAQTEAATQATGEDATEAVSTPTAKMTQTLPPATEIGTGLLPDKLSVVGTKEIPMTVKPGGAASIPQELLAKLKADAAQKANSLVNAVEVVSAQAVTWNDGSLGCPRPGLMYTQALVPGYQVILKVGDTQYDYHVSQRGSFVECGPTLKPPKSTVNPPS